MSTKQSNEMPKNQGTPKNLEEAIILAFCSAPPGGIEKVKEHFYRVMRDFMAQKFHVSYIRMENWRNGNSTVLTPEEILKECFEQLTTRESK